MSSPQIDWYEGHIYCKTRIVDSFCIFERRVDKVAIFSFFGLLNPNSHVKPKSLNWRILMFFLGWTASWSEWNLLNRYHLQFHSPPNSFTSHPILKTCCLFAQTFTWQNCKREKAPHPHIPIKSRSVEWVSFVMDGKSLCQTFPQYCTFSKRSAKMQKTFLNTRSRDIDSTLLDEN